MKKFFYSQSVFFSVFLGFTFNAAAASDSLEEYKSLIVDPMFGMPALWLRNGENEPAVKLDLSDKGFDFSLDNAQSWEVLLRKSNGPELFEVELPVLNVEREDRFYKLNLFIPEDVPVDLFDVEVIVKGGQNRYSDYRPNAVKIIDEIKNHFFIAHITDIHVDDLRGLMVNYTETEGYKVIRKMIKTINLLDPEFVIITGDNVFGDSYSREYPHLYELLQDFDVPIFMSPGNHDAINHNYWKTQGTVDGIEAFKELFAPLNFSFRYGELLYISLNSMDWSAFDRRGVSIVTPTPGGQMRADQLDWFEDLLAFTDAQLILAGYHHPPHYSFQGTGANRVMSLAGEYSVDAVLTGHTHADEVMWDEDVLYLTTASLMFSSFGGSYPAFRILEAEENELVSWNYEEPHWSVPVYKDSTPNAPLWNRTIPSLYSLFSPSNNGISSSVTATVVNSLRKDLEGISLEFVMPTPQQGRTYAVSGGEIVEKYDTAGKQIWYVKTDIDADSEKEVLIKEVDLNVLLKPRSNNGIFDKRGKAAHIKI